MRERKKGLLLSKPELNPQLEGETPFEKEGKKEEGPTPKSNKHVDETPQVK